MFITPAFAQGIGGDSGNFLVSLMPFVLIFVVMYFLILRPQQKRVKDHREMVASLRRGDTVVTTGGLVGKVSKVVDNEEDQVEIAQGIKVRVIRSMISQVRSRGEPVADSDQK